MKIIKKVFFLIFALFLLSTLFPNIINYQRKLDFYNKIKEKLSKEEKRQTELKTEIIKKKSQSELEKIIRNQLNLSKENEIIIVLPSPNLTSTPTPTIKLTNWQKWLKIFLK